MLLFLRKATEATERFLNERTKRSGAENLRAVSLHVCTQYGNLSHVYQIAAFAEGAPHSGVVGTH